MLTLPSRRSTPATLLAAVLLLVAELPRAADCAPLALYGVQLPDPLHVYTLQETKLENIRNDPFLVVFKTHVPSLRPYEIPYFPPKDYLTAEEQEENTPPNITANSDTKQEQTTPDNASEPVRDQKPATSEASDAKPDDKIDIDKLPELVELKPEVLLEAIDASKQDAEEGQTARPGDAAQFLLDSPDETEKEAPAKDAPQDEKLADSDQGADKEKVKIENESSQKEEEKENDTSKKGDDLKVPPEKQNSEGETPIKVENEEENTENKEQENDKNKNDVDDVESSDRVEKEEVKKQEV